jgi:hypothetical protein
MRRSSPRFQLFILSPIALALALPAASYATVIISGGPILPSYPADIEVSAEGGSPISIAGTVNGSGCTLGPEGGCETSTATASYFFADASVSGSGSTAGGVATANTAGSADVTFFFEVVGPATGLVPLIFTGSGSTSASGVEASAYAYFETPGGDLYACSGTGPSAASCLLEGSPLPTSYSGSIDYSVSPNVPYDLSLMASGGATEGSGSWSASVDPEVTINPSFAPAGDYTLEFSAGPLSSVVPEPSSSLLLGAGMLVLLGCVKLKRPVH